MTASSWKQLFFYGEVVGFLLAWVVGVVVTLRSQPAGPSISGADSLTAVSDLRSFPEIRE